jgi:hypothetical protein
MEGVLIVPAQLAADAALEDFEADFDEVVGAWIAEQNAAWYADYDEAQDCLEALLETRTVLAEMQAREQRCLARLEELALEDAGATAPGLIKELAWRSMVAEVAVATRQADRTVQTQLGRAAKLVADLPKTLAALESGRISFQHARVILEHAEGIEADALPEYEELTVSRAESTTPGKLASTARIAAARLREGSFEERHAKARDERRVEIRDLDDGMSQLIHWLPTVHAAAIFDRLTRQAKAVAAAEDPRSRDQLRSDLAVDLLLTGEPSCDPDAPHSAAEGIRAQIAIVIPALTLLGESDEPATLAGRGPIDLDTACRLASQASELVRVLTHPVTGMVVEADSYRLTASLRRYLEQRDRHCRFPTCNRDARWCDIDHTIAWEDGGRSSPGNLAVPCRGHHTLKHHSRWRVRQVAPGVLEWTSPLGRIVRTDAAA